MLDYLLPGEGKMYFIYTVGFLPVAGADVFHDLLMLDDGVVKTALGRQGVYPELLGLGVYALIYVAYNAVSAKGYDVLVELGIGLDRFFHIPL